ARSAAGPNEQILDAPLQHVVGREADRVSHPSAFERLIEGGQREGSVRADNDGLPLRAVAVNDGEEHVVPPVRTVGQVTLDIDSSESPVHGTQEQSAYNGHFESVCYHPVFVFNPEGDCLAAKLRPGNVHSAKGWDEVLLPIVDRYRRRRQRVVVRADAAFARPEIYEALEHRGVRYAIRLPANNVLERQIEDLLTRPRGRPSHAPLVRYRSFLYQAASWDRPRRVIAKIEHHLGELFPRVGFIVTTLTGTNRAVVRFYNQRGTAEQWIKEGKAATHWTRLSCHRFRANEVRLLLGVIAYNLGNLLRRLVLPVSIQSWSLTSLQQRLFKTGAPLVRNARYLTLQLAESYLTGSLFRQILALMFI